jgi:PAS domain S-box-containing protein
LAASPPKILFIADDCTDTRLIRAMLEESSSPAVEVQVTEQLSPGMEVLSRGEIDLVFLDLSLPECRGLSTLAHVRNYAQQTPIVVLCSSDSDDETLGLRAMEKGALDYLVKGQLDRELVAHLARHATQLAFANAAHRECAAHFNVVFDAIRTGVLLIEPETEVIIELNRAACELIGLSRNQIVDESLGEFIHRPPEKKNSRFSLRSGIRDNEGELITADGRRIPILQTSVPITFGGKTYILKNISNASERQRSRESLQLLAEKRTILERVVNDSPAVVFLWRVGDDWPVEFVSDSVRQFGYSPEEFYTEQVHFASIIHRDDLERVAAEVRQCQARGRDAGISRQYRIITKSGEVRWVDDRTRIRKGDDGAITHYQGIILDISDRKNAEEELKKHHDHLEELVFERTGKLRESEERFRLVAENFPDGLISLHDEDLRYVLIEGQGLSKAGLAKEKMLGKHISDIFPPEFCKTIEPHCRAALEGEKRTYEITFGEREFLGTVVPFQEAGGKRYVMSVVHDITERKHAEKEIAIFRKFAEASEQGLGMADLEGNITYANPTLCRFLGQQKPEDACGTNVGDYYSETDVPRLQNEILPAVLERGSQTVELPLRSIDGRFTPAIQSIFLIRGERGDPLCFANVITDITERKHVEQELREHSDHLKAQVAERNGELTKSEMKYKALFDNTAMSITSWAFHEHEWRMELINTVGAKNLGGTPDQLTGKILGELISDPDFLKTSVQRFEAIAESGIGAEYEDQIKLPTGKYWFKSILLPVKNTTGKTIEIQVISEDITERKRMEDIQATLFAISEATNLSRNVKDLLETIRRALGTLIDTTNFYVALYNPRTELYSFPYSVDQYDTTDFTPQQLKKSLTDYVRRTGKSLFADGKTDVELERAGEVELVGQPSSVWLGVPLSTSKGILGVVAVQSYTDPETYTAADLDLMIFVSRHIAIAIERKKAEEALRLAKFTTDHSGDAAFWMGPDARFVYVNDTACCKLGYSREELLSMTVHDIDPDFPAEVWPEHWQAVKQRGSFIIESRHCNKNGVVFPVEITVNYLEFEGREYNCAFARDITERKRAEEALKESEGRYQEMFNSIIEGISIVDEHETIIFCNPSFAKIIEEDSAEEMIGRNLLDYIPAEQKDLILAQTARRKKGESSQYEVRIITAKGNNRIILASVSPRYDGAGNYSGAFGAIIDITETKRLQEFAAQAQRLETAGRIAGQVAHDFNNLLGPLVAYPELITNYLPPAHPARRYVAAMEKAAEQMSEINQQLLTLGRRGHYNHEPMDLNEVIGQIVDQVFPVPDKLQLHQDLGADLMNIKGGKSQIMRAISNLMANAREAMHDSGDLTIRTENYYVMKPSGNITSIPQGEYVKLTVADTGCGITPDNLPQIFDPFFTTKTTDHHKGSGLGLSIVFAVVKDHQGYIDCESAPDQGTSFYLYFPITREHVAAVEDEQLTGGDEYILLVDDDPIQREVTGDLLRELGYTVAAAESGERAIELLGKRRPDLMILDMVMPGGMDGAETYKKADEVYPLQKAIIVSGYAESGRVAEALRLGAGGFVKKPITIQSLAQAIRRELEREASPAAALRAENRQ